MTLRLITNPTACVVLPKSIRIKEVTYRGDEKTFHIPNSGPIEKELNETLQLNKVGNDVYVTKDQISMCCD